VGRKAALYFADSYYNWKFGELDRRFEKFIYTSYRMDYFLHDGQHVFERAREAVKLPDRQHVTLAQLPQQSVIKLNKIGYSVTMASFVTRKFGNAFNG